MKNIHGLLLIGCSALVLAGCGADDVASPGDGVVVVPGTPTPSPGPSPSPSPTPTPGTGPAADCPDGTTDAGTIASTVGELRNCQISGKIAADLTLPNLSGTIYSLDGKVEVGDDAGANVSSPSGQQATLTVEPGVTVFGASGADFLAVNRGSKIIAEGTATKPIVFTSRRNVVGESTASSIGEWGGMVILGRGPIADCADSGATGGTNQCQAPVEGTSGSLYGGSAAADNSGVLKYVQIRYSGFKVDNDNELNGITLAGVGSGTTVENVQIHNSSDDGIEWFGGRVNGRHLVMTGVDDDSIDVDSGYKGALQFVLVVQRSDGGNHVIEGDSTASTPGVQDNFTPRTHLKMSNFTFVTPRTDAALRIRGGMDLTMVNGVISTPSGGTCIRIDDETTVQNSGDDEQGPPVFNSVFMGECGTPFEGSNGVTATLVQNTFEGGSNNTSNGTLTLSSVFINGSNESGVPAFDASSADGYFTSTAYIGAVRDASDTWYQGWTCGLGSGASCLDILTPGA